MPLTAFGLQEAVPKSTGFITLIKRTQMLTSHFLTPIYFYISAIPTSSQSCEANHSAYTCWELRYGRIAVSQARSRLLTCALLARATLSSIGRELRSAVLSSPSGPTDSSRVCTVSISKCQRMGTNTMTGNRTAHHELESIIVHCSDASDAGF